MFNARAWLVWLAAALLVAMAATNPLYLVIVLLCVALVRASHGTGNSLPAWRFGLTVVVFSTVYNTLLTHFGDTVLVTLPRTIPLVGGPLTLEAAAFGASRGLALWAILAVSSVLNDILSPYELVRLTPRFLRQAGLVISIALAFVPQTLKSFREIREAQAIRGHQLRGIRDLTALLVPLLADSLEKAVQLAEAMEARGYGRKSQASDLGSQILMVGGLIGLLVGWLVEAYWRNGIGWVVSMISLIALVIGFRMAMACTPRTTRYKSQAWSTRDTLLVLLGAAPLAAVTALILIESPALVYYPYPRVMLPPFDARLGICLALLGVPAFMRPREERQSIAQSATAAGK